MVHNYWEWYRVWRTMWVILQCLEVISNHIRIMHSLRYIYLGIESIEDRLQNLTDTSNHTWCGQFLAPVTLNKEIVMKLTKRQLTKIIREEKRKMLQEQHPPPPNAIRDPIQDFTNLVIELLDIHGEYPEMLIGIIETEAAK